MSLLIPDEHYVLSNYLLLLLYTCKTKDQLRKALWVVFYYGYDSYKTTVFNKTWELICKSAGVSPQYDTEHGIKKINESVVDLIAECLYENPQSIEWVEYLRNMNFEENSADEVKKHFKENKRDMVPGDEDKK